MIPDVYKFLMYDGPLISSSSGDRPSIPSTSSRPVYFVMAKNVKFFTHFSGAAGSMQTLSEIRKPSRSALPYYKI
jgi:hypothetical protein